MQLVHFPRSIGLRQAGCPICLEVPERPCGSDSTSLRTLAPVVVKPEADSKKASINEEKYWERWNIENEKLPERERTIEPLHCNCDSKYKIVLVVPDYVEIDQKALDEYNGKFYSKKEWADLGHIEYGTLITHENGEKERKKPIRPDYIQWIKVRKIHVPNKGYKNRELFVADSSVNSFV